MLKIKILSILLLLPTLLFAQQHFDIILKNGKIIDGSRLYTNSTVLVLRTRWGKVVEQHDFYVDTQEIVDFDRKLTELGVEAIPAPAG